MHSLLARLGAQCLNNFTAQKYFRNNKMQDKPEQHKQTQAEAGKKPKDNTTQDQLRKENTSQNMIQHEKKRQNMTQFKKTRQDKTKYDTI